MRKIIEILLWLFVFSIPVYCLSDGWPGSSKKQPSRSMGVAEVNNGDLYQEYVCAVLRYQLMGPNRTPTEWYWGKDGK